MTWWIPGAADGSIQRTDDAYQYDLLSSKIVSSFNTFCWWYIHFLFLIIISFHKRLLFWNCFISNWWIFSLKGSFLSIWVHCTQVSRYGCTIVMYFYTAMVNNRKQYSYLSFSRSRLSAFLVDNSKKNETSTFLLECAQTRLKLSIVCIFTRPLFCCP